MKIMMKNPKMWGVLFCLVLRGGVAENFSPNARYEVCFTPGGKCTELVVDAIQSAQSQIQVQAYSFTSKPIEEALIEAHQRGVKVRVIVDKSVVTTDNNAAELLSRYHIPVWVDNRPSIAHNKVMIIDHQKVITGSFNFTKSAQTRNAENIIMIEDNHLADSYFRNWQKRQAVSDFFVSQGSEKIKVPKREAPSSAKLWLDHSSKVLMQVLER